VVLATAVLLPCSAKWKQHRVAVVQQQLPPLSESGDSDLDSNPVTGGKKQQSTGDNSSRGGATAQASAEEALAIVLWGSG